ncbi:MAG: hypothetical protein ACRDTT_16640 [Pseudonocardiaceae bacterium]
MGERSTSHSSSSQQNSCWPPTVEESGDEFFDVLALDLVGGRGSPASVAYPR